MVPVNFTADTEVVCAKTSILNTLLFRQKQTAFISAYTGLNVKQFSSVLTQGKTANANEYNESTVNPRLSGFFDYLDFLEFLLLFSKVFSFVLVSLIFIFSVIWAIDRPHYSAQSPQVQIIEV